jgi:DNA-binding response OmpR family regulator
MIRAHQFREPMKILIADDDPLIVQLVRSGLRAQGWDVLVAADAMQVAMFAMQSTPDAILLDINMPGGTGVTALKRLKQSVKTSQIPVVVLSGTQDPTIPDTVRELGAQAFLPKPVNLDEVVRVLSGLIGA